MMTTHVVQYSGGIGSWAAAQRVIAEHGTADVVLLFADTQVEDDDLYRFLGDAAAQIGVPVTVVADGRTRSRSSRTRGSSAIPGLHHARSTSRFGPAGPG